MTAEELARFPLADKHVELVRGQLIVREPPSTRHGRIAANLGYYLSDFVRRNGLGVVFAQDTGFKIASNPDSVRGPDVAFLAQERVGEIPRRGFADLAPDLVAEILSPDDRPGELLAKVGDWLAAGTKLVWVIDPERVQARAYRLDGSVSLIGVDGVLAGEDVLPGFCCPLKEIVS